MCVCVCVCVCVCMCVCMCVCVCVCFSSIQHTTVSTENASRPKSIKSRNSNSPVTIQIEQKLHLEFIPRDTEESEFLDLVDFGGAAFSVETVI